MIAGTKAEVLSRIGARLTTARVLDVLYFSVERYRTDAASVLERVAALGAPRLVVRSSALREDSRTASMAGVYTSVLDVDAANAAGLESAIERVIASYAGGRDDQVLVQPMLANAAVSGVIMSRDLEHGSPYYVINYDDESGRTDSITGGKGVNKTVFVYRDCPPDFLDSPRMRRFVEMAAEVERVCGGHPLDIEFAMDHAGELYLLQVRPISVSGSWSPGIEEEVRRSLRFIEGFVRDRSKRRRGLLGRRTILGEMPDWNPAEMIGTTPRPLAASLYRGLITRGTWREARAAMGYRRLGSEELMVMIGGRPFIDVRNSFNSFLPEGLSDATGERLVDAALDRLDAHPHLHDKVEFEVAHTCLDFGFRAAFDERYGGVLDPSERLEFETRLRALTVRNVSVEADGSLARALATVDTLAREQDARRLDWAALPESLDILSQVHDLLDHAVRLGTLPFSIVARHAFIAEMLLRSAVFRGALSPDRLLAFKRSVRTITHDMTNALRAVCEGRQSEAAFMARFGHLRPGTYDISSLRYADRPDFFAHSALPEAGSAAPAFALTADEDRDLRALIAESGLAPIEPETLLAYAARAIAGREGAKFVFTRNLSDALEGLAAWGERQGLSRDDVSYLPLDAILDTLTAPVLRDSGAHFGDVVERGRHAVTLAGAFRLSYLIRGVRDVYVVPLHRSAPNFVGSGRIEGPVVRLDPRTPAGTALAGKIVCIENADPGYDWVFAKGIRGLITKFGGANSHMAIRCAEFGLPAAIGCGEQAFERLVAAGAVEINGGNRILRPLYEHGAGQAD